MSYVYLQGMDTLPRLEVEMLLHFEILHSGGKHLILKELPCSISSFVLVNADSSNYKVFDVNIQSDFVRSRDFRNLFLCQGMISPRHEDTLAVIGSTVLQGKIMLALLINNRGGDAALWEGRSSRQGSSWLLLV